MKKIAKIVALMSIAAALFMSCKPSTDDPAASEPAAEKKEETAAGPEVVDLELSIEEWGGSIAEDGTVTYTNNYGAVNLGDGKAKAGDKITVVFAEVPSKVQFYYVDDPYETKEFDWGTGIDGAYCHYSGEITATTYEITLEGDVAVMAIQAMNDKTATCKIVSAKLTKKAE